MTKADYRAKIRIDRELIVDSSKAAGFQIADAVNLYLLGKSDPKIVFHGPTDWKSLNHPEKAGDAGRECWRVNPLRGSTSGVLRSSRVFVHVA